MDRLQGHTTEPRHLLQRNQTTLDDTLHFTINHLNQLVTEARENQILRAKASKRGEILFSLIC